MAPLIVRLALATLSAFLGGLAAVGLGRTASRHMLTLVFVALGTLLAVTLFDVLPDAKESLTWPMFSAAAASGFLLFWLISRYVYNICPACSAPGMEEFSQHGHSSDAGRRLQGVVWLLTAALAVHCTLDGLAVVVGDDLAHGLDLPVLIAIIVHKFPEGMALALFLLSGGQKPLAALAWTLLVESTTFFGGIIGAHLLTQQSVFWLALIFAHVGGGFVYLVYTTIAGFMGNRATRNQPIVFGGGLAFTVTSALLWSIHEHIR